MQLVYRPIERPLKAPVGGRRRNPYSISYDRCLDELERELEHLKATDVVLYASFHESQLRLSGLPRADAKPSSPGVMLTFRARDLGYRRLIGNKFDDWQGNVRAIGLALQRLRLVEESIDTGGAQYEGFKALPSAIELGPPMPKTPEEAAAQLAKAAGVPDDPGSVRILLDKDGAALKVTYRLAMKRVHPDVGGSAQLVQLVTRCREIIEQANADR